MLGQVLIASPHVSVIFRYFQPQTSDPGPSLAHHAATGAQQGHSEGESWRNVQHLRNAAFEKYRMSSERARSPLAFLHVLWKNA